MAAGGAVTGVSPLAADRELSGQLIDSGASVLVTVPALEERARGRRAGRRAWSTTPPALLAGAAGARLPPRPGRPRAAAVLERHDRPAEGRDAHARQPRRRRSRQLELAAAADASATSCSAVAPFSHIMGFVVTRRAAAVLRARRWSRCRGSTPGGCSTSSTRTASRCSSCRRRSWPRSRARPRERTTCARSSSIVCGGAPLSAERHARGRRPAARTPPSARATASPRPRSAITGPDRDTARVPGSVGRALAGHGAARRRRRAVGARPAEHARLPRAPGRHGGADRP